MFQVEWYPPLALATRCQEHLLRRPRPIWPSPRRRACAPPVDHISRACSACETVRPRGAHLQRIFRTRSNGGTSLLPRGRVRGRASHPRAAAADAADRRTNARFGAVEAVVARRRRRPAWLTTTRKIDAFARTAASRWSPVGISEAWATARTRLEAWWSALREASCSRRRAHPPASKSANEPRGVTTHRVRRLGTRVVEADGRVGLRTRQSTFVSPRAPWPVRLRRRDRRSRSRRRRRHRRSIDARRSWSGGRKPGADATRSTWRRRLRLWSRWGRRAALAERCKRRSRASSRAAVLPSRAVAAQARTSSRYAIARLRRRDKERDVVERELRRELTCPLAVEQLQRSLASPRTRHTGRVDSGKPGRRGASAGRR